MPQTAIAEGMKASAATETASAILFGFMQLLHLHLGADIRAAGKVRFAQRGNLLFRA